MIQAKTTSLNNLLTFHQHLRTLSEELKNAFLTKFGLKNFKLNLFVFQIRLLAKADCPKNSFLIKADLAQQSEPSKADPAKLL